MCSTTKLRIYLQNVRKNYALVDTFLESQKDHYDIFFVQEPPWNFIRYALSTVSLEGDKVVGAAIHPDWTQVVRVPKDSEDIPRVMAFIFIFILFFCSKIYNAVLDRSPWQTIYNK